MTDENTTDYGQCTCYAPLASGGLTAVTAVANRQRGHAAELAGIKVDAGAKALSAQVKAVVAQARFNETIDAEQWRVTLYLEPCPGPLDRGWELAVVMTDRMARGLLPAAEQRQLALGCSDHWHLGRVQPLPGNAHAARLAALSTDLEEGDRLILPPAVDDLARLEQETLDQATEVQIISHLGGLLGHPDPALASRSARTWFPLVSGNRFNNRLAWVEVSVMAGNPQPEGEIGSDRIGFAADIPKGLAEQARNVLHTARDMDGKPGNWSTSVRFEHTAFTDNSFELALVMADRIARGRDVPAAARLLATGCSSRWAGGKVEDVGGVEEKSRLFEEQAAAGDRVLVPEQWRDALPDGFRRSLERRGVSLGILDSIQ